MSTIISVSPFRCRVWHLHARLDEHITEESCKAEIESFEAHGRCLWLTHLLTRVYKFRPHPFTQARSGDEAVRDSQAAGIECAHLTREHDIPLVIDEVQTGFARTGTLFAFQRAGIEPDVLVLSKALGGGFPLAVIVYDQALDLWPKGMHAGTFRGNQIALVHELLTPVHIPHRGQSQVQLSLSFCDLWLLS